MGQTKHDFTIIFKRFDYKLWVLTILFKKVFLQLGWETPRLFGPLGFKSDTCPVFGEIIVQKQSAKVVFPIIIVDKECSIVGIHIELLVRGETTNIVLNKPSVFVHLFAVPRPSTSPFGMTPRVPEPKQFNDFLFVIELNDCGDSICVLED